ncbi:c-type cytochrome [Croceicoccus bisphenolivorans]|uniref:c-type cytochrome n=1 Tax=Croceicoccus bisphenolivorans TaxID=1783232 RepID=UPI0009ED2136|nr:cytochrome c [Croceicoccus bisphenolivorans]
MIRPVLSLVAASLALAACSQRDDADTSQVAGDGGTAELAPTSPGEQVFDKWCAPCHAAGPRYPGTASLAQKYNGEIPAALEERDDLTPEIVAYFVRNGIMVMPPFRKTEISDDELAALGAYLSHEPEPAIPARPD